MFRLKLTLASVVLFTVSLASTSASAQSYTRSQSSTTFSSIAGTGTPLALTSTDDGYASISMPFNFAFFGNTIFSASSIYATSNGYLDMGSPTAELTNVLLPTSGAPDGIIAPFWDDLYGLTADVVFYEVQGGNTLVVEWDQAHYDFRSDSISMQVRLHSGTNEIELIYGPRTGGASWSGSVGVEDTTGSVGYGEVCSPSCTLADVPSGTVIRYAPNGSPPQAADLVVQFVDPLPSTVQPGATASLNWEVDNIGTGMSGASDVGLYAGLSATVTTNDNLIAYSSVSAMSAGGFATGLFSVSIPNNLSGTYFVAAIADPFSSLSEANESNNLLSLGSVIVGAGTTITVTTEGLPDAAMGTFYNTQLTQVGANVPTWNIASGQLPPGLTLSVSGSINGTPTQTGFFSFTVQASESGKTPGTANLSINVTQGGGGPVITTTTLPQAFVGIPYTFTLQATGGTAPYGFNILAPKPEWLNVLNGALTGTPDAAGAFDLTVSVTDNEARSNTAMLHLDVTAPTALAVNITPLSAETNRDFSAQVVTGGHPPYTITVTSGMLPAGLTFDMFGNLSGSATRAGMFNVGISVADSDSPPATAMGTIPVTVTMHVGLSITEGDEITVYTNADTHYQLHAMGGTEPYTWSLVQGFLQEGLTLDPDGFIVGRITLASTATVTLAVVDAMSQTDQTTVYVKAGPYRPAGSGGRGGGGDRGGCSCRSAEEARAEGIASLFVLFSIAIVLLVRRRA